MERQVADQNKHLYEAYAKIVELQEENSELFYEDVMDEVISIADMNYG